MANDDNNSAVRSTRTGGERFDVDLQPTELERIDAALRFSREVLEAAGATQVCWTGLASTHVQGTCRMGDDPARSVVDRNGESHDVKRLFVGDALARPAHALREPVADDHGARDAGSPSTWTPMRTATSARRPADVTVAA